ncbi:hypothetical protein SLEP1_g59216 [Rubroshorea leprosula]|uniref:Secreted protein n=1 Tax=Rubroshorea leprosula TaxID=152421 RepID=A0AAV5MUW4_9ROSI|nr:hypothetical protein SLEP1_g59216 [Rubroshorea leprosula]
MSRCPRVSLLLLLPCTEQEPQPPPTPPLERNRISRSVLLCVFLPCCPRISAGCASFDFFLISQNSPALPAGLTQPPASVLAGKIVVLDPWGTLVRGLSLRYYMIEVSKLW